MLESIVLSFVGTAVPALIAAVGLLWREVRKLSDDLRKAEADNAQKAAEIKELQKDHDEFKTWKMTALMRLHIIEMHRDQCRTLLIQNRIDVPEEPQMDPEKAKLIYDRISGSLF